VFTNYYKIKFLVLNLGSRDDFGNGNILSDLNPYYLKIMHKGFSTFNSRNSFKNKDKLQIYNITTP